MRIPRLIAALLLAVGAASSDASAQVARGPWSGGVTADAAVVKVRMAQATSGAELLVSTTPGDFGSPLAVVNPAASHATSNVAAFNLAGLSADTQYYYAVRRNGVVDTANAGRFRTALPATGGSFGFAFGSCANTGSNHPVFDHIRNSGPRFFLSPGDFHYQDIGVNNPQLFRDAFDSVLGSTRQSQLYRSTPIAYVWDDHDFGPDNSDKNSASRPAARQVYREYVPHHALASGNTEQAPIDQAFSYGKARFILSDLRSERDSRFVTDNTSKKMMNDTQLAWFKNQVLDAKGKGQAIFWVSTVPWIGSASNNEDHWAGYATQRGEIARFLDDNGVDNLTILAGDAHMLAADDGSNANYSGDPTAAKIRVLHAASLDRTGSVKGGPYSQGAFAAQSGFGQYAYVDVTDLGSSLQISYSGRAVDGSGNMTERLAYSFSVPVPEPASLSVLLGVAAMALRRRR